MQPVRLRPHQRRRHSSVDCAPTQYALRVLRSMQSRPEHRRSSDHLPICSCVEATPLLDRMERLHHGDRSSAPQSISVPQLTMPLLSSRSADIRTVVAHCLSITIIYLSNHQKMELAKYS